MMSPLLFKTHKGTDNLIAFHVHTLFFFGSLGFPVRDPRLRPLCGPSPTPSNPSGRPCFPPQAGGPHPCSPVAVSIGLHTSHCEDDAYGDGVEGMPPWCARARGGVPATHR